MLMSLWYRQLNSVLVAAATRISPVTFHFCSNDGSDHDKRLLWLPRKPYCRQLLQFLWHRRCGCLPWLKSPWPNPVLSHTASVSCEFCSGMPSSFKCACSDAQLYRVGLRWLESARRPARVDGKTHTSCLWCTLVFPTVSRYVLNFLWQGFLYSCLRLSVVLSPYLQLSVIGFLLLACFCLFL